MVAIGVKPKVPTRSASACWCRQEQGRHASERRLRQNIGRSIMIRILVPTAALVFGAALAQPAAAQSGVDLVKQAVAAQGGAAAVTAPKTTIIKGEAKHWEPGQSYSPTGEPKFLGDSTYTQTVDNATRTSRVDWDRDMKYPAVERLKYSEITTPTFGVLVVDKGAQRPMLG